MSQKPSASQDFAPLTFNAEDIRGWGNQESWQFRFSRRWARSGPLGKGWLPRKIGKWFGKNVRDTFRTRNGARLVIDPPNLDMYAAMSVGDGVWGIDVLTVTCALLRPGDVFFDIGANVGSIALDVAFQYKDAVRVYAFEPQPQLARALAISGGLNGLANLHAFSMMVGDENRDGELFLSSHSIHASAVARESGMPSIRCPMTTVDHLLAAGILPPPNIIKVDVEGAESQVFHGAAETLKQHRPAIIFEADANASRFGYTRRQLCEYLQSLAPYRIYFMTEPHRIEPADGRLDEDVGLNMLAATTDHDVSGLLKGLNPPQR